MAAPAGVRVTTHLLAREEAAALAWMLELVAQRCWLAGDLDMAMGLEGGASALRLVSAHAEDRTLSITDVAIDDLTTITWNLLDVAAREPDSIADMAEAEWAEIGADLVARDQTGGAFTTFLMECPRPEDLPSYAAGLVGRLRTAAGVEVAV